MVNVTAIMSKGPRIRKGSVLTDIKNTSVIEFDDISEDEMNKMIDGTLTEFDEGDLIDGTVVKIEHDEVLVDIGFKSEGVIPARELSIRKDADPSEVVELAIASRHLFSRRKIKMAVSSSPRSAQSTSVLGFRSRTNSRLAKWSPVKSSKSSRVVLSSTSVCVASCRHLSSISVA